MKIGILRETKTPPDRRVPLSPEQCRILDEKYNGHELVVQSSDIRCFSDDEYRDSGVQVAQHLDDCNFLMGVKEVDIPALLPGKTYMFFSHTAKEQPYNRELLRTILEKGITLIDYEYLTREDMSRIVAFGRWAGIVGAYNGLRGYGFREKRYNLPPAWNFTGLEMLNNSLKELPVGNCRIVLTGGGRVAGGAIEVLKSAGIMEVTPDDYLKKQYNHAVFCRLDPEYYAVHKDGLAFDFNHFVSNPGEYENAFLPFAEASDIYIACHFWDPDSPVLLSADDLKDGKIPIKVIADISCDINGPIASTTRPSTIEEPFYCYFPPTKEELSDPFDKRGITVMAVDNLPGELPRDASMDFGRALTENVIPSLLKADSEGVIERATIAKDGKLTERYAYLENYVAGK